MVYPKPRYGEAILMKPENFEWEAVEDQAGFSRKNLCIFSERSLQFSMLKVEPRARGVQLSRGGIQIGFVLSGSGTVNGEALRKQSAFSGREDFELASDEGMEVLLVGLPVFAEARQETLVAAEWSSPCARSRSCASPPRRCCLRSRPARPRHRRRSSRASNSRCWSAFRPAAAATCSPASMADGLARHVEGKPIVVVQNQPGAGSVIAMNNYANRVPRDGTTVLSGTGQLLVRLLLGLDGARAKIGDLQALVATPMGRITYASPQTGFSIKDLLNPVSPSSLACRKSSRPSMQCSGLSVLKANFNSITGYPGKADLRLALLRNEINLDSQATPIFEQSVRPSVKNGQAIPLFAQGFMDGDRLTRDPAAPDVPSVGEAYQAVHGVAPSGPAWDSYKAVARAIGNGGKIMMMHSDAPAEARAALKRAVEAMVKDPAYMKSAESVLEGYGFNTGEQLEKNIAAIGQMDAASIAWLQELLSRDFRMKFK